VWMVLLAEEEEVHMEAIIHLHNSINHPALLLLPRIETDILRSMTSPTVLELTSTRKFLKLVRELSVKFLRRDVEQIGVK